MSTTRLPLSGARISTWFRGKPVKKIRAADAGSTGVGNHRHGSKDERRSLTQLPPRLLQESVLLNAEANDPPALFKVLIAALVSLARLWT
jgi:hypothetical protein